MRADGQNVTFRIGDSKLPEVGPLMYDIELCLKVWWVDVSESGVQLDVIGKQFCSWSMKMVDYIIYEEVEKERAEDTTLRNTTSNLARMWKGGVDFDYLILIFYEHPSDRLWRFLLWLPSRFTVTLRWSSYDLSPRHRRIGTSLIWAGRGVCKGGVGASKKLVPMNRVGIHNRRVHSAEVL